MPARVLSIFKATKVADGSEPTHDESVSVVKLNKEDESKVSNTSEAKTVALDEEQTNHSTE